MIAGMSISAGFCIGLMLGLGFGDIWIIKWCFITLAFSSIAAGCSLLHGTVNENKVTTAGYLILSVINAVLCLIIAINIFSGYSELDNFWSSIDSQHVWIVYGLIWIFTCFVYIYFGIIVFSFIMQLVSETSVDPMEPSDVLEVEEEANKQPEKEPPVEEDNESILTRRSSTWTMKLAT